MKRKLFNDMVGCATLSRPRLLFSRIKVFFPKDGIHNYRIGYGLNLNRSGSSILIVSYLESSVIHETASSTVMFASCNCEAKDLRILTNWGFCSFKK